MGFVELVAAMDRAAMGHLGAVDVVYQSINGQSPTVKGIFDAQYILAKGDAESGVESRGPAVFLRLADLPIPPGSDAPILTIGGTNYRVTERAPDGLGGVLLHLRAIVV